LYRSREGSTQKVKVNGDSLIAAATSNHTDTVSTAGAYSYQLEAVDKSGNASEPSDAFLVTKKQTFNFKFGVVEVKYHKRKKVVLLAWPQPQKPSGYMVLRKSETDPSWRPLSGMILNADFEDKSINKKTQYHYQVRAYSDGGEVVVSAPVMIRTGK
jgi:hypothetical protein